MASPICLFLVPVAELAGPFISDLQLTGVLCKVSVIAMKKIKIETSPLELALH